MWVQPLGQEESPGGGNGNPLQYSCLENPMDRRAWWATVHGVAKSQTRLSNGHTLPWEQGDYGYFARGCLRSTGITVDAR